jgi:hypothetical protein
MFQVSRNGISVHIKISFCHFFHSKLFFSVSAAIRQKLFAGKKNFFFEMEVNPSQQVEDDQTTIQHQSGRPFQY